VWFVMSLVCLCCLCCPLLWCVAYPIGVNLAWRFSLASSGLHAAAERQLTPIFAEYVPTHRA
jgi:hypothetical protein